MTEKEYNRYSNLENQMQKTYDAKVNSYRTEADYKQGMQQFVKYLAAETKMNKIDNIKARDIIGFVAKMKEANLSAATQKTYLSAIRDFADRRGIDPRTIPSNNRLELEKRVHGHVDRSWTAKEFKDFKDISRIYDDKKEMGNRMGLILDIGRYFGCRVEGILNLDKNIINKALSTGELWTKEKNGKMNVKPVETEKQKEILNKIKELPTWGQQNKLFIDKDFKATYKEVQNFIYNNRDKVQEPERMKNIDARNSFKENGKIVKGNLSEHGLRHTYLKEQMKVRLDKGMSIKEASREVSQLAGHSRGEVTKIYLAESD